MSQIRKGDTVLVVEGPHTGLRGTVLALYKAYREGAQLRVVAVEDANGKEIEVRQAFVRVDVRRPVGGGAASSSCPFCGENDFDLIGLKAHILRGQCEPFNRTISPEQESAENTTKGE